MACEIDYLKNKYKGDNLKVLANHHYQIKDELANSKLFRKDYQGVLQFFKDKLVPEAIAKIGSINKRYQSYLPSGTKIVHMDSNGLKININPIADYVLAENNASEKQHQEKTIQDLNQLEKIFLYEGSKESDKGAVPDDINEVKENTSKFFTQVIDDLKIKLKALKQTLREKPYAKGYKEQIDNLEKAIENKSELEAITNYVTMSSANLRAAKKQFDVIKERYKNADNLTQTEVTDFDERLNEIKEFLHFYSNLADIRTILKENDIKLQSKSKEKIKDDFGVLLTPALEQAIDRVDLSSVASVDEFFKTLESLGTGSFDLVLLRNYVNALDKNDQTEERQLQLAIENHAGIVKDMQNYFIDLTADWLFPYLDVTNKQLEAKGHGEDVISKRELKVLLRKANKDVSFFSRHLGATISSKDPVTALVAVALKDLIYKAKADTDAVLYNLTDLYDKANINPKDRDKYHETFLRQASVKWYKTDSEGKPVLDDNGNKIYSDEKGNPYYTKMLAFHEDLFYDQYDKTYDKFKRELARELDNDRLLFDKNPALFIQDHKAFKVYVNFNSGSTEQEFNDKWIETYIDKKRKQSYGNWHSINSDIRKDKIALLERKKASMTPKRFENWIRSNMTIVENKSYYDENGEQIFRKDLDEENGKVVPQEYLTGIVLKENEYANYAGDFTVPSRKVYENNSPEYQKIKNDPYYQALYKAYKESNDNYVKSRRLSYGIIPQIGKDLTFGDKYLEDGKPSKDKLKKQISDAWEGEDEEETIKDYDEEGNEIFVKVSRVRQKVDGSIVKNIPIRHTILFDDQKALSTNLLETVSLFTNAANNYKTFSTIEPNVELLKTIINGDAALGLKARQVEAENSKGNPIVSFFTDGVPKYLLKEKGIRVNEMLTEFIDDVVYGEEEEKVTVRILGTDLSLNKLANNLGFITSLYSMAGNVTAGINNVILGNINTFSESIGGKYYNVSDWTDAKKKFYSALGQGDFFKDLAENNWNKKSLYTQLQIHFDALQGEFLDPRGKIVTGSLANKLWSRDTLFFNQHITEFEIQMTGMLAMLQGYKLANGKSLLDAYQKSTNGRMEIKPEFKEFVTPELEQDFRNKLHALNKQHHGNYNKFDKSGLQRKWYGKLALMFRKYIYTSFKARIGSKQIDFEMGDTVQGYYNLSFDVGRRFFNKMREDIKNNQAFMLKKFLSEGLNENEQYALKRSAAELSFLVVATVIVKALSVMDLDDDDDDGWKFIQLEAKRTQQDLLTFIPPASFSVIMRLFTNPSAAFNVIEKANDLIQQLFSDPFGEYSRKTGFADKGDSKLLTKALKLTPGVRQAITLMTPGEQLKYYDLIKTGK